MNNSRIIEFALGDTSYEDDVDWAKYFSADPREREQYTRNLYGGTNPNGQQMQTVKWNKMADFSQRQDNTRVVPPPAIMKQRQMRKVLPEVTVAKTVTPELRRRQQERALSYMSEANDLIAQDVEQKQADREVQAKSMTQPNKTEMNNLAGLSAIIGGTGLLAGVGLAAPLTMGAAAWPVVSSFAAKTGLGLAGGMGGDVLMNVLTDYFSDGRYKTFGEFAEDMTNGYIGRENAVFVNPLAMAGAGAGSKIGGAVSNRAFPMRYIEEALGFTTPREINSHNSAIASEVTASEPEHFVSELDWSPESWFGKYARRDTWTVFDEQSLAMHVPEYIAIERVSKENGTWLKMPDGSKWQGDPREWVMSMSKSAEWLQVLNGFKSGVPSYYIKTLPSYRGTVYEANEPIVYESFANYKGMPIHDLFSPEGGTYAFALPKGAKVKTITTEGGTWDAIKVDGDVKHIETLIKEAEAEGFDALRINGIQEGPQQFLPGYQVTDDFIILSGKNRKILTGSNGNFNRDEDNNFGGLAPFIIPVGLELGAAGNNN